MHDNRVPCYSVKVEIPSDHGRPAISYYLVRADSQTAAIQAVEKILPGNWGAVDATLTAIRMETVEALDLRCGIPRQI